MKFHEQSFSGYHMHTDRQTDRQTDFWILMRERAEKKIPPVTVARSEKFGILGVHNTNGKIPLDTNLL
jgi:hypothetical protein